MIKSVGKRLFDIVLSFLGLLILLPFFICISVAIVIGSGFPVFYKQVRVGQDGREFRLFKFRTMRPDADSKGLLTVGGRDPRVTSIGYYLRKFKIDELPQLLNVLIGDMSIVGPRPEVKKYVDLYTSEQKQVLSVKPGITDYASIRFINENDLLARSSDPERLYVEEIMPSKLQLNIKYIKEKGFLTDMSIILETFKKIVR